MPELPEVETICRAIRPHVIGRTVVAVRTHVPRLRHPLDEEALNTHLAGRRILDVRRRAKYIIMEVEGARGLIIHLGMTGAFRISPADEPLHTHDRVSWILSDGKHWRFQDIRRFGMVVICNLDKPGAEPEDVQHLGPEPLENSFNPEYLLNTLAARSKPIKNALLDQNLIAGLGNIYVNEALFLTNISPLRPSNTLSFNDCERLVEAIQAVLKASLESGGTTISDFKSVDGSEGKFALQLNVYGKTNAACPRCGPNHPIARIVQAGRSTFYCPTCQS